MTIPIGRQIGTLAEAQGIWQRSLRDRVARRALRQAEADYLDEGFTAAIATLEWVRDHEAAIKRAHAAIEAGEEPA